MNNAGLSDDDQRRPWSDLPDQLVLSILEILHNAVDILSFSGVCRPWRSFTLSALRDGTLIPPPPLFLRFDSSSSLTLLSPSSFPNPFPRSSRSNPFWLRSDRTLIGYSHGFLIFQTPSFDIVFINPFSGHQICPPAINLSPYETILYAFTTANPIHDKESLVVLFSSHEIYYYWRPGDAEWSHQQIIRDTIDDEIEIIQATSFNGVCYYLDPYGRIFTIQFFPKFVYKELSAKGVPKDHNVLRLFQWRGDVLMICVKICTDDDSAKLRVSRLNVEGSVPEWIAVEESARDYCIFIDSLGSRPVVSAKPERWGCRTNCVYVSEHAANTWVVFPLDGSTFQWPRRTSYRRVNKQPVWVTLDIA